MLRSRVLLRLPSMSRKRLISCIGWSNSDLLVLLKADMLDYYGASGHYSLKPWSLSIWEASHAVISSLFVVLISMKIGPTRTPRSSVSKTPTSQCSSLGASSKEKRTTSEVLPDSRPAANPTSKNPSPSIPHPLCTPTPNGFVRIATSHSNSIGGVPGFFIRITEVSH